MILLQYVTKFEKNHSEGSIYYLFSVFCNCFFNKTDSVRNTMVVFHLLLSIKPQKILFG